MLYVISVLLRVSVWGSLLGLLGYSGAQYARFSTITTWFIVYSMVCAGITLGLAMEPHDE